MKCLGIILVLASALFFAVSSYYGKVVTNITDMTALVTSFSRFVIGTVIMFIYMIYTKKSFKPGNMKPILARAIFNCAGLILFSWSLQYTTITNANMLNMTYPVFVILLAPFITREKNKKSTFVYLSVIMLGSYVISNPSFANANIGDGIAMASAVVAAIAILFLTEASKYNEGYLIVFYLMFFGMFINLPFAYNDLAAFDYAGLSPVLLSAVTGFMGQLSLTLAYRYVDSATGALVSTSRIIMAAAIGFIFLSEPINSRIIFGIMLITSALAGISGFFNKKAEKEICVEEV